MDDGKRGMKRGKVTGMAELATLIGPVFVPMKKRRARGDKQRHRQNDDQARSLHQRTVPHTLQ
jgi:hypothetical protein